MFYIELIRAVRLNQTVNKSNEVKPDSCECEWANVDFKDVLGAVPSHQDGNIL